MNALIQSICAMAALKLHIYRSLCYLLINQLNIDNPTIAQSAGAVEYTNCFSTEV